MEMEPAGNALRRTRRGSPAVYYLRPLIIAGVVLLVLGITAERTLLTWLGVASLALSMLLGFVIHTSYRRWREQGRDIVCG